jgi:hypothetical protein
MVSRSHGKFLFSGKPGVMRPNSPLFEIARVLVRFNHCCHCPVQSKNSDASDVGGDESYEALA